MRIYTGGVGCAGWESREGALAFPRSASGGQPQSGQESTLAQKRVSDGSLNSNLWKEEGAWSLDFYTSGSATEFSKLEKWV